MASIKHAWSEMVQFRQNIVPRGMMLPELASHESHPWRDSPNSRAVRHARPPGLGRLILIPICWFFSIQSITNPYSCSLKSVNLQSFLLGEVAPGEPPVCLCAGLFFLWLRRGLRHLWLSLLPCSSLPRDSRGFQEKTWWWLKGYPPVIKGGWLSGKRNEHHLSIGDCNVWLPQNKQKY